MRLFKSPKNLMLTVRNDITLDKIKIRIAIEFSFNIVVPMQYIWERVIIL